MTQPTQPCYHLQVLNISASTPITQLFQHYCAQPWSMLLDSADSQHENGRFDLFVAKPICTIEAYLQQVWVQQSGQPIEQFDEPNPLALLQRLMAQNLITIEQDEHIDDHTLPFKSGALGYFGYDLGRCFENLPDRHKGRYDSPDMAVGLYTWCVIKDNHSGKFLLVNRSDHPAPTAAEVEQLAQRQHIQSDFHLTTGWQSNMSKADYMQKMQRIDEYLRAGDCYQVNLAQRFEATFRGDSWRAYLALRQANQAPFSAYIRLADSSIVSISPERFLQVKQAKVQTKPIKGTRPRGKNHDDDLAQKQALMRSDKDRAENLMIVDLLRNDLSRSCKPGSIDVPHLFEIESFEAVHHLVSTVIGTLDTHKTSLDLLQGAFPGGSITGAPKVRAMEIIEELEPHKRNIYCGSIGYIDSNGNMDTNICIRTLLFEQQNVFCWAGGGIVLDSQPSSEYQESFDKVAKILPVLQAL